MNANLKKFCAPGCEIHDEQIALSNGVSLTMMTFLPSRRQGFPAVVFVAGWVSRIEGWEHVLRDMTRDFPVYYIETREKISSRVPRGAKFDVYAIGDDIVQAVDQLDLQDNQYLLFGSSLGATVIMDCYARLKTKPCCLALVAPNAEFRIPFLWKVIIALFYPPFYFLLKPWIKWHLKYFRLNVKKDWAQYEKYCRTLDCADPKKLKSAAQAFSKYRIWEALKTIDAPVLLIGGSHDKLHEPENLKRMTEKLAIIKYVDLETNARTHSAEVVEAIREFIRDHILKNFE
ncbi:alpha/beta hydrolase [bacterium]|nr:alpha/beta hydrolase [bacterium]